MRHLLDTHAFLWYVEGDPQFSARALPHVLHVAALPFHHRDPFDRLLITQSVLESMPLISADTAFDAYGVQRLW